MKKEKKFDSTVILKIEKEIYEKMKQKAKENGLNTSAYLRYLIISDLNKHTNKSLRLHL